MKKLMSVLAIVGAAALVLSGCSPQPTPESVALGFTEAVFGDSDQLPSSYMCDGSTKYDDLSYAEPATDIEIGEIEPIDSSGQQRIRVTFEHPDVVDDRVIATISVADLCVVSVQ